MASGHLRRTVAGALIAAGICALPLAAAARPGFEGIGDLPGGEFYSRALAISADGTTVVGASAVTSTPTAFRRARPFRWIGGVMTALALPAHCPDDVETQGRAVKVSEDGRVILGDVISGTSIDCSGTTLWESGEPIPLGVYGCPSADWIPYGNAILSDRGVAFSLCRKPFSAPAMRRLYRWEGRLVSEVDLDILTTNFRALITAVSPDESVFVGSARFPGHLDDTPARWTREEATDLGELVCEPARHADSCGSATDLSDDGSVVVGFTDSSLAMLNNNVGFRWEAGVLQSLGHPSPPNQRAPSSRASAVSADGSIVVGTNEELPVYPNLPVLEVFVWDSVHGRRDLQRLLAQAYPALLDGWWIYEANDISADGRSVVGTGGNPDGQFEGWIARLPIDAELDIRPGDPGNALPIIRPARVPVALLSSEAFDAASIDPATLALGPAGAAPEAIPAPRLRDVNGDGYPDLVAFFRADALGLDESDSEACLIGDTFEGDRLLGCDAIRVLPD